MIEYKTSCQVLLEMGKITPSVQDEVLKELPGERFGALMVRKILEKKIISEDDLALALSTQLKIPFIDILSYDLSEEVIKSIPRGLVAKYYCIPTNKLGDTITLTVCDPDDMNALKKQEELLNCRIQFLITKLSMIKKKLSSAYGVKQR